MKWFALLLAVASTTAIAQTVILQDGTVVELTPNQSVYISETPVFVLTELKPVVEGEDLIPEAGTPEWCEWFEAQSDGPIAPSFDTDYLIYTRNCR